MTRSAEYAAHAARFHPPPPLPRLPRPRPAVARVFLSPMPLRRASAHSSRLSPGSGGRRLYAAVEEPDLETKHKYSQALYWKVPQSPPPPYRADTARLGSA